MAEPLIKYRIHQNNANSIELTHKGLGVRLKRLRKKFQNILKGYSKRNFYKQLMQRIDQSGMKVRHPHLIKIYHCYIGRI